MRFTQEEYDAMMARVEQLGSPSLSAYIRLLAADDVRRGGRIDAIVGDVLDALGRQPDEKLKPLAERLLGLV